MLAYCLPCTSSQVQYFMSFVFLKSIMGHNDNLVGELFAVQAWGSWQLKKRRNLIGLTVSEGFMLAEWRHGGQYIWELTFWSTSRTQRANWESCESFETSKPACPSDTPPPKGGTLPNSFLPPTRGPSVQTWTYGDHSHPNHHRDPASEKEVVSNWETHT